MLLENLFQRFVERSPVAVMARGLLERALDTTAVDALFERTARRQYTRALLFSSAVQLLAEVVCGLRPSLRAAYQHSPEPLSVSITSVFNKVNGVEPEVSRALVRHAADRLAPVIDALGGGRPALLPGYRVLILDGNHLAATEHRVHELRFTRAGALPGQALVVLDPRWRLAVDMIPCEDGHAQERSLLGQVVARVARGDLWIADRNFCTTGFLFGVARRRGRFLIRQHAATLYWRPRGRRRYRGRSPTGKVYEQRIELRDPETGQTLPARRVTVVLDTPTRDGEAVLHVLTNLAVRAATAERVTQLYLQRWSIERLFLELTQTLECEIRTLGYPKAALFAFGLGLVAHGVTAVIKAALSAGRDADQVDRAVSGYHLSLEIASTYTGMMVALGPEPWRVFATAEPAAVAELLRSLTGHVCWSRYQKHARGPKKPPPTRASGKKVKHVATARLLAQRKQPKQAP